MTLVSSYVLKWCLSTFTCSFNNFLEVFFLLKDHTPLLLRLFLTHPFMSKGKRDCFSKLRVFC